MKNGNKIHYDFKTGKYSCVVTNQHGVNEDTSDFRVRTAPEIRQMLRDVEAREGQTDVVFTVQADAYPPPRVRW